METRDIPVLAAGQYELYAKRKGARGYHTSDDKKGGNFSLHHVIPYRYPCFIGFVVEMSVDRIESIGRSDPFIKSLAFLLENVQKTVLPRDWGSRLPEGDTIRHDFAWMGCNLFIGPSGVWRLYDPGSAPEPLKPHSFEQHRWDTLHGLRTFVDGHVNAWHTGGVEDGDASSTSVTIGEITLGTVKSLLVQLQALAGYKDACEFDPKDWIVYDSDDPKWQTASTKLNSPLTSKEDKKTAKRTLETLAHDDTFEKDCYLPISHRNVRFAGEDMPEWRAFWRLRREDETIPTLKLMANFVLQ